MYLTDASAAERSVVRRLNRAFIGIWRDTTGIRHDDFRLLSRCRAIESRKDVMSK